MHKWKNMRKGMAVILAAAMVGQSVPVYASDFEAEIETISDFSEHIEPEKEEDIVIIPQETEQGVQIEPAEMPALENQIKVDEIIIVEETTEPENSTEVDENTAAEEATETETETENQTEAIELVTVNEAAGSVDIGETESTEKEERSAETEAEIVDYGTCCNDLTWTLDSEGVLRVDGTGTLASGNIYSSKQENSISSWEELEIKSVVTGENITGIGSYAFYDCRSLSSVEMSEVQTIGYRTFYDCNNLTSIELPKVQTIGSDAFKDCSSLSSIKLPEVQTIGSGAFGTSEIGACSSLSSIELPKVQTIGNGAFSDCSNLSSIKLPEVQTIGTSAFSDCSNLSSIKLPEVQTIGTSAFEDCSNLTNIELPKVQTIGSSAFKNCSSLTSIELPETQTIGDHAFAYCSSLNGIKMPKVQILGEYAFTYCCELKEINIPEGITEIKEGTFDNATKLRKITLPDSLEVIEGRAFYNNDFLSLTIPENVKKIEKYAFASSSDHKIKGEGKQLIFKGEYPENGIEANTFSKQFIVAFVKGDSWTSHLQDTYGGGVTWCTEDPVVEDIVRIYMSGSNSYSHPSYYILGADGTLAIYGSNRCIDAPELDDKSVIKKIEFVGIPTAIGYGAFDGCTNLESITIPDAVKDIGSYAFNNCTSLQSVQLPEGLEVLGDYAFSGDEKLTAINIPSSLTTIGSSAFRGTALEEIIIPEGVEIISSSAFRNCTKLKKIIFPSTLTEIASWAFSGTKPEIVIFKGNAPNLYNGAFDGADTSSTATKFYYPASAQWSNGDKLSLNFWGSAYAYERVVPGEYHYNNDATCISDGTETTECLCGCGETDTRTAEGTKDPNKHMYTDQYETLMDGSVVSRCDLCKKLKIEIQESGACGESLTWEIYHSNILTISGTGDMFNYNDENPAPWSGKNIKYCKIESGVTSIGSSAFQDCTDLTNIIIEDGIEIIGDYAFYGCTGLTEVQLPESVYSIGEVAFGNCTALKKLTAYEGLTQIADNSFRRCSALTIYGYTGTTIYEYAKNKGIPFESLGYLGICGDGMEWRLIGEELTISGESTTMFEFTQYDKAPWSGLNVKHCTVKEGVKNISSYAFADCASLTEISLPSTIQEIGENAFKGCTGLTKIELPSEITEIGENAFKGCTGLTKAVLPSTITEIEESVFAGCASLTEVELPDSVTKIGNRAFAGCTSLQTVNHSGMLTEIGEEAFKGCIGLETFAIPDGVTEIKKGTFDGCALTTVQLPSALQTIGSRAFAGNRFIEITIPASVTEMDQQAFVGCEQLQEYVVDGENSSYSSANGFLYNKEKTTLISCPAGKSGSISVSRTVKTIGDYAFSDCKKITELTLPTTLDEIGSYAFANMTLRRIEIPADVTSIGAHAFKGCLQLEAIDAEAENPNFASQNGILCNADKTSVKLCPPGLKKVNLWEGITEISAGAFDGMAEGSVIDLPFSIKNMSSENDFGTATVLRVYENAVIKWYLQSKGYKYESKGNYAVSWNSADSHHMEMAYMQLRDNLSKRPNGTYKLTGEVVSYKLQLESDGIAYQFTFTDPEKSEITISFQLGKYGVTDNEYTMKFQALRASHLWYSCTLYKSQDVFKSNDQKTFAWSIYDPNNGIVDKSTANQLASSTLYMALTSLSSCLYYCGRLDMKDIGFTSYYTVNTIHTVTSDNGKAPTCTEAGRTEQIWCSICGALETAGDTIPATGHKETVIPAKAATCTESGWTAGKKCSVCGEIVKAPTEAGAALGHTMKEVIDSNAKCETAGSKHNECTRCGFKEAGKTIPATGHKETVIPAKAATCTEDGLTEGSRCSVCGKTLKKQEKAAKALGHRLKTVIEKEANCGKTGSRYEKCSVCGYQSAKEKIPATGQHRYGDYQVTSEPTAVAAGKKVRTCSVCGKQEAVSIEKLEPTIKLNVTSIKLKVKQSTTKVTVSGLAKGDEVVSWTTSNPKIVTVNKAGKITAKNKTGSAVLTVTLKSGMQATVKVKVQKSAVKTTKISGLSKSLTLKVKEKATLKPVLSPITSVQKITYTTSKKSVASVSSKGVITAKKAGKAKITVKAGTKKFVITVTVKK